MRDPRGDSSMLPIPVRSSVSEIYQILAWVAKKIMNG
jgi:hypothetical protein